MVHTMRPTSSDLQEPGRETHCWSGYVSCEVSVNVGFMENKTEDEVLKNLRRPASALKTGIDDLHGEIKTMNRNNIIKK